jgi:tRNA nucleotidyltransferase (CCA-adding enzyme)
MVALGAVFLLLVAPDLPGIGVLHGVLAVVGAWSLLVFWLLRRFPAREVGILSTVVEMAAVTIAVYVAMEAQDLYLLYGLVILGAALRFGLGASVWSSLVMSAMYAAVVLPDAPPDGLDALPVRIAYLVGFGVVAGLFSRIVIGRAEENARLQQRLSEEERERELTREQDLLSRLGRDFGASLDRAATFEAVAAGSAPVLGGATAVFAIDDAERRLVLAAVAGPDGELAEAWRAFADGRPPRLGEGLIGAVGATAASRQARAPDIPTGDPDGMRALELDWLVAIPILAGGRMQGVLATAGRNDRPLDERIRRLGEAAGAASTYDVGERFGTIGFVFGEPGAHVPVEITTYRAEHYPDESRHPEVTFGQSLTDDLGRRDFTINALLYDPFTEEIVDPHGGREDLAARRLRAVDARTFGEDPLRALRALQLAARFELAVEPGTARLCAAMPLHELPAERVFGEIEKLLLRAPRPGYGLRLASDWGLLPSLAPELVPLASTPQDAEWHPEGDVWTHTLLALDQAAPLVDDLDRPRALAVMLATLCHDLGKPATTRFERGRLRSPGHEEAGLPPTESLLDRWNVHTLLGYDVRAQVLALVGNHLKPGQLYDDRERVSDGAIRRLARKCEPALLYRVARADCLGRTGDFAPVAMEWFLTRVQELEVAERPPRPILMGRHVVAMGVPPGPEVGRIVHAVYERQLDGAVTDLAQAEAEARQLISAARTLGGLGGSEALGR